MNEVEPLALEPEHLNEPALDPIIVNRRRKEVEERDDGGRREVAEWVSSKRTLRHPLMQLDTQRVNVDRRRSSPRRARLDAHGRHARGELGVVLVLACEVGILAQQVVQRWPGDTGVLER